MKRRAPGGLYRGMRKLVVVLAVAACADLERSEVEQHGLQPDAPPPTTAITSVAAD